MAKAKGEKMKGRKGRGREGREGEKNIRNNYMATALAAVPTNAYRSGTKMSALYECRRHE